jgi:hypothetical protein
MEQLNVEYLNIDELQPYEKNSRIHNKEQIIQLSKSIKEFGFTNPIIIDEDSMILAGHGRVEAFKMLDKTYFETGIDKIPCVRLKGLSKDQKKAYVIADNKIAENSEWNYELYMSELKHLNEVNFDLTTIGLDADMNFGDYTPTYSHNLQSNPVNEQDMNTSQENISSNLDNYQKNTSAEAKEVICPKCKYEFKVEGW